MHSTMQQGPLLISEILTYASRLYGATGTAVTWTAEGPRTISYAELGRRTAQLANALRSTLDITADQRVGTFMWNNAEHVEAYFAVPSMGAVLHPLNIRLFPEQLVYVANHAEDQVVIVDNSLAPAFAKLLPQMRTVKHVVVNGALAPEVRESLLATGRQVHDYEQLIAGQPDSYDWPELDETSAAAMCYTSGTTGDPKGVVYSHRSIYLHSLQLGLASTLGVGPTDRVLPVVPMFHANAWGLVHGALAVGADLVLPDRFLQAEPLAMMIEKEHVTAGGAVPTIWADLLNYLDTHQVDTSSMRTVLVGGSACPPALLKAFDERHNIRVLHAYGMTETSPLVSVAVPPPRVEGEEAFRYRVTQGRLAVGVQARIVAPDGSELPWDGVTQGELELAGPWITGTYYRAAPAEVAEKFDNGWLRTGDIATITPDGFLTLTDRVKDIIKSGGEWISSVDLENALMGHPAVLEASVVGVPDERWGERPLATVVVRAGHEVTPQELREFLSGKFAKWQLPDRWAFVDEVPKTSVGKFDKKALRRQYAEGELWVQTVEAAPAGQ